MNSRSSVNETNLVNFSADLPTLNQLEAKDLLSFPFDHLYACHSEGSEGGRRQSVQLGKEVEISAQRAQPIDDAGASSSRHSHLVERLATAENQNKKLKELLIFHLDLIQQQNASDRLTAAENQNKRLKELLIYHHDLIQQQNDAITKREKLFQALKQENESVSTYFSVVVLLIWSWTTFLFPSKYKELHCTFCTFLWTKSLLLKKLSPSAR